jgi:hypothetical protein
MAVYKLARSMGGIMLRLILGVVAGVVVWGIGVTILNLGLRHGWADYAAAEKATTFTLPMMIARLSMSAVSSLAGGAAASAVSRERFRAALGVGVIFLILFIPVHASIWTKFPIWYHLTFLTSLPILSVIGGRFARA